MVQHGGVLVHGLALGEGLVVHHPRDRVGGKAPKVLPDNRNRHARRGHVLLRAGVDEPKVATRCRAGMRMLLDMSATSGMPLGLGQVDEARCRIPYCSS